MESNPLKPLRGLILSILLLATGCAIPNSTPSEFPLPFESTSTPPHLPPSATPSMPFILLLTVAAEETLASQLSMWAQEAELELRISSVHDPEWSDLVSKKDLRALVSVATGEGARIGSLLEPGIPWVAVDEPGVQHGDLVSVVRRSAHREEQIWFLAGLTTGFATRNGRVGWLKGPDSIHVGLLEEGFLRGLRYVCVACRLTPFELDSFSQTALRVNAIDTLFVSVASLSEEMISLLRESDVPVMLLGDPISSDVELNLLAEIMLDPASLIPGELGFLLQGGTGRNLQLSLQNGGIHLVKIDPAIITEGRRRALLEVLAGLESGELRTGLEEERDTFP